MRAIVITEYGGPDVLAIAERPEPEAKAGHVIVDWPADTSGQEVETPEAE